MPASPVRAPLNVKVDGKTVPLQCVIVTGDFNIDYNKKQIFYASLEASKRASGQLMQIGAEVYNSSDNTLLVTPRYFNPRTMSDTEALAQSNIDNHFVATSRSASFAATNYGYAVPNIPDAIRRRNIVLGDSVAHYAELDQKGFKEGDYQEALKNFANQLAGDKNNYINRQGALVGARLISDHLPVVIEVDIN